LALASISGTREWRANRASSGVIQISRRPV
jgi:hypothetical protein